MNKRVVITGAGVVSPVGIGVDKVWDSVSHGKSGISVCEKIDTSELETKVAAEVKGFNPSDFMEKKEIKRMDRFTQFAMASAKMAVENSGLDFSKIDSYRAGVIIGSGIGGIQTLEDQHSVIMTKGPNRVSPFFIPMMICNMAAGLIAIQYKAKGLNECVVTACASSSNALGDAFKVIQRGDADIMISGGAEASITPLAFAGFCSMRAMSTTEDPSIACRPFDACRDGFVMGEGSTILILEELEHALNRGANILGEIVGYACTNDAYHITTPAPNGEGAAKCMELALKDANISPNSIKYINAHGTSTDYNDKYETAAIKSVFREHINDVFISSTKSMTGHLLGAAGALEALITTLALNKSFVPPTIALDNPDPECDLNYTPNVGIVVENMVYGLSNSLGFGGHNATIIVKKYQ